MIFLDENIEFGSWFWDLKTNRVTFSPNWFLSLGYEVPNNLNQDISTWRELVHPDDLPNVMVLVNKHLEGKTPFYHCSNRLLMKSGEYRTNLDVGIVFARNKNGNPLIMHGVDINLDQAPELKKEMDDYKKKFNGANLTGREISVCESFKEGKDDDEIGEALYISPHTVKTHIKNICRKMNLRGRTKLMYFLFNNSFVEIDLYPPSSQTYKD